VESRDRKGQQYNGKMVFKPENYFIATVNATDQLSIKESFFFSTSTASLHLTNLIGFYYIYFD
jgi:hypothetical protein